MRKVLDAQSKRAPEELEAARARIESARQREVCTRKCKAVKGLAVRSRALAAEGLRQMAESRAPEEYAAVQGRWVSAQMASKARQEKKCAKLGRSRRRISRGRSPRSTGSGSEGSGRRRRVVARRDRSCSAGASDSDASAVSVLRAASDSEEEAMEEAAGLVGASDARSMAAVGGEGLALVPVAGPLRQDSDEEDVASENESALASGSESEPDAHPIAVRGRSRGDAEAGAVAALLRQLANEPEDAAECAAKFSLYEGYATEVTGMRDTVLQFHGEARPTLPPAVAAEMDRQVEGIDSEDAMRIPERSQEWFVYHMMRQAERNNLRMAAVLEGMEKKLEFLASNDQLECPVCLESFDGEERAPETLGCCHKVCKECWHNWSKVTRGRPFCPFCRHEDFLGAMARRASDGQEAGGSDSDSA